jgi:nucleotide-binding universal stress UspA family protein
MRVLVIFDGSDDGFAGLQRSVDMLKAAGTKHEIMCALVGWPPRKSPIWDRAFTKQPMLDDLHRAMAEVASTEFKRLRELFGAVGNVTTEYLEGDPVTEIVALIDRQKPDLLAGGLTRGNDKESVEATVFAVVRRTSVPAFLTFGKF